MTSTTLTFPLASDEDSDDVRDAIDTGSALWRKGETVDALRWLRRARDFADDGGHDRRALELARIAADLSTISSPPTACPVAEPHRSKLPEPPSLVRKFTGVPSVAPSVKPQPTPSARHTTSASASLRPTAPSQRKSSIPRPLSHERSSVVVTPQLVSVSVRIGSVESDGSMRVYPLKDQTQTSTASQGILVLSENLWTTLEPR